MTLSSYAKAQIQDYLRPNQFSVFFVPNFFTLFGIDYSSILVRSCQFPGQTINTNYTLYNNKKQTYATSMDLDPVSMEIACDVNSQAHSFFLDWQARIIQPKTRVMGYKSEYSGYVEIDQHQRLFAIAGISASRAKLINAYPVNVGPIELSHDTNDEICKFSVSFQYDDIEYTHGVTGMKSTLYSLGVGAVGLTGLI